MILSRERYVYFYILTNVLADQLIFKGIDEGMGTDHQSVVLSLSALECLAVYKALEVDHGLVTVCNCAVLNGYQSGVLLLNLL